MSCTTKIEDFVYYTFANINSSTFTTSLCILRDIYRTELISFVTTLYKKTSKFVY